MLPIHVSCTVLPSDTILKSHAVNIWYIFIRETDPFVSHRVCSDIGNAGVTKTEKQLHLQYLIADMGVVIITNKKNIIHDCEYVIIIRS